MIRRVSALVFMFLILCSRFSRAAVPVNVDVVKKTVVFLYPPEADGTPDKDHPLGTGFQVGVPKKGDTTSYLFLATARHIVDPNWAFCGPNPSKIFLRFNKTNYDSARDDTGVEYVSVDLIVKGRPSYGVSNDDQIDAAVILLNLTQFPQSKYDYLPALLSDFATPEEIKTLTIGDEIMSAGLLPGASGTRRNYPVFKFGHISNIPDEPIFTGCLGMPQLRQERVWLIAANLVAGNSGSPILCVPTGAPGVILGAGIQRPALIGVQSMSFGGSDVAGMTPVEDVFKIIESTGLNLELYRGPPRNK